MVRSILSVLSVLALVTGVSCAPAPNKAPEISLADPVTNAAKQETAIPEKKEVLTLQTTKGKVVIHLYPEWSPLGVERVKELVGIGFYDDCAFFRIVPDFIVQFGMNGFPEVHNQWAEKNIDDEPVKVPNRRGYVTFAKTQSPNTRSTQLFISLKDNSSSLDPQGFAPIGQVVEGMDVVEKLNGEYTEQPNQERIRERGNIYLKRSFPRLDYIQKAVLGDAAPASDATAADETKPATPEGEKTEKPEAASTESKKAE